jgi:lipid II:glycine glycyltransferase (peptidoglycan interpeptide bridge formation enzyme)
MTITLLNSNANPADKGSEKGHERGKWNAFVVEHFPPVGAVLQSYEWGDFKETFHGKVLRFVILDGNEWVGCFNLEIHGLPFGLSYGYAPRGPVLHTGIKNNPAKVKEAFIAIADHLKKHFSYLLFVRLEPPYAEQFDFYNSLPFARNSYYLQPRFNQVVTLAPSDVMMKSFSNDVRHDIRAAERLEISISLCEALSPEHEAAFIEMKNDTQARSGRGIFPSDIYFENFLKKFSVDTSTTEIPHLCFCVASNKDGEAVAINLNLLYGKTFTYLYGASYSGSKSKRAPAYLHWKTMEYATDQGFSYYDLGGVDDTLWKGLTYFKRQFGGTTMEYVGNVDIVLKPLLYTFYNQIKKARLKVK